MTAPPKRTYDPRWGRVLVIDSSKTKTIPKAIVELIDDRTFREKYHPNDDGVPEHCDYLVTGSSLSPSVEWRAQRCMAIPVVLPEAADWLRTEIKKVTIMGGTVWIRVFRRNE